MMFCVIFCVCRIISTTWRIFGGNRTTDQPAIDLFFDCKLTLCLGNYNL